MSLTDYIADGFNLKIIIFALQIVKKTNLLQEEEEMAAAGTKENPIVVEDSQTIMAAKGEESRFNALIQSTTDAVIETELLLMPEELDKYKKMYCSTYVDLGRCYLFTNDKRGEVNRNLYQRMECVGKRE